MTAEIVIMNKEAVAIAADSAVSLVTGPTDRPQKIFTSANKIFGLSNYHTVCLMIYNNSTFMGIPWETIIDAYRKNLGSKTFASLREYAEHIIDFLSKDKELIPKEIEDLFFIATFYNYFLFIRSLIQQNANDVVRMKGGVSGEEISEIVIKIIQDIYEKLSVAPFLAHVKEPQIKDLGAAFDEEIAKAIKQVFEQIPVSDVMIAKLKEIALLFFMKDIGSFNPLQQNVSGVVITGFGEKEIFPSLISLSIEGRVSDILKFTVDEHNQITFDSGAVIVPFAQREMVDIFMSSMDPRLGEELLGSISSTFHIYTDALINSIGKLNDSEKDELRGAFQPKVDDIVMQLNAELNNFRAANFVPIVNVVSSLPKYELAAMAESLVNLTSLKRRVSMQAETVAGPVDVAVISKSDGFVWIKKKQYYTPELNMRLSIPIEKVVEHEQKGN